MIAKKLYILSKDSLQLFRWPRPHKLKAVNWFVQVLLNTLRREVSDIIVILTYLVLGVMKSFCSWMLPSFNSDYTKNMVSESKENYTQITETGD